MVIIEIVIVSALSKKKEIDLHNNLLLKYLGGDGANNGANGPRTSV